MAASSSVLIKLLVLVGCALAASAATTHTVGGSAGWSTGQTYDTWASGQTFAVGDKLVFNFAGGHTVTEVTKSDYEACSVSGNPISDTTTGPATIDLTSAGAHYYICTVAGHCTGGMKLAITVGSGSGSGTPPSTTPGSGTPPTTPSSSKPNGASASLQASAVAAAAAGVLVKLALF